MVFYIPEWKALSMAEEVNHLQHNIYTLRGAEIRDAQVWAAYIGNILARYGNEVEVNFGPHTWPVWGNEDVVAVGYRSIAVSIQNARPSYVRSITKS